MDDILQIMIWLILAFIIISFVLPSLSSFLKQKITGADESESFDLDKLILQKKNLIQMNLAKTESAFTLALDRENKTELQDFIDSWRWSQLTEQQKEFIHEAQQIWPTQTIEKQDVVKTVEWLINVQGIEETQFLEISVFKRGLLFYTGALKISPHPNEPQKLFQETYRVIQNSNRPIAELKSDLI